MTKKSFIITLLIVIITGLAIEWFSFQKIEQILYDFNTEGKDQSLHDSIKNYQAISCNFNFFKPTYGLVTFAHYQYPEASIDWKSFSIGFYQLERELIFSSNWKLNQIGGTKLENTTYEELLKMVKEDCTQFQKNHYIGDDHPHWTYRKAKTPEEIAQEEAERKAENDQHDALLKEEADRLRQFFIPLNELPDSLKEEIIAQTGDWKDLKDDEKVFLFFADQFNREDLSADLVQKIDQFFREQGKYSAEEYLPY